MRLGDLDALKTKIEINFSRKPEAQAIYKHLIDIIEDTPTVYPICEDKACKYRVNERPQGEWIVDEDNVFQNYMKCSICNEGAEWLDGGSQFLSNFCPNCGAKMLGGSK